MPLPMLFWSLDVKATTTTTNFTDSHEACIEQWYFINNYSSCRYFPKHDKLSVAPTPTSVGWSPHVKSSLTMKLVMKNLSGYSNLKKNKVWLWGMENTIYIVYSDIYSDRTVIPLQGFTTPFLLLWYKSTKNRTEKSWNFFFFLPVGTGSEW